MRHKYSSGNLVEDLGRTVQAMMVWGMISLILVPLLLLIILLLVVFR